MAISPEIKIHLIHDLLPFWLGMIDKENGGFYGCVDAEGNIDKKADKGCVLNSRILWVFSTCYKLCMDGALSEVKLQDAGYSSVDILEAARHAYNFFRDNYFDQEYGGIFWSVTYDGKPSDTTKHAYNHAFAIYALVFIRPRIRPYQTNNYYEALVRQHRVTEEVNDIVSHSGKKKKGKKTLKTARQPDEGGETSD